MQLPTRTEHPLKKQLINEYGLRLWQLSKMTGKSVSYIYNVLNGIIEMPPEIEAKLRAIVNEIRADREQQAVNR